MLNKQFLISMPISTGTYKEFISSIIRLAKSRTSSYVCVANVHMVVEAKKSETFANYVSNADIITPDGMPIAKAMKSLYGIDQDRVAGMDLLPDLLSVAQDNKLSVFFYGGSQLMLDKTAEYLDENFPDLIIAGTYSPPFRKLTAKEETDVINIINKSDPAIIFVILGCPKQEGWMFNMKNKIPGVMIGVGGALPVLIGMQKRAPFWMQKNSLEWLFRLFQEPKRLFKRYFNTNSIFIGLYAKALLSKFLKNSNT
jgi:N-acetylglucosaminyldiphosphoundecaprenol N-acetyl-beta-D-mannosaminyltransferase